VKPKVPHFKSIIGGLLKQPRKFARTKGAAVSAGSKPKRRQEESRGHATPARGPTPATFVAAAAALLCSMLVAACGSSSANGSDGGNAGDRGGLNDLGSPVDVAIGLPGSPVSLGTAGNYVMLAKTGIATVPTSVVTGNLGISPAAATYVTEFSLSADATNVFATSAQVTGRVYAADYAAPTPSNLTTAVQDMEIAFIDAAGRAPDIIALGAGNIGGMTLSPGVYKWSTGLLIPTSLTLSGSAAGVWIFQISQDLTLSNATAVSLTGGAVPKNVFWQVGGSASLGTTSHLEGIVLAQTSITMGTGASINGRLLAQTAVNIDSSTVAAPAP
jgi:hypothetical protein